MGDDLHLRTPATGRPAWLPAPPTPTNQESPRPSALPGRPFAAGDLVQLRDGRVAEVTGERSGQRLLVTLADDQPVLVASADIDRFLGPAA